MNRRTFFTITTGVLLTVALTGCSKDTSWNDSMTNFQHAVQAQLTQDGTEGTLDCGTDAVKIEVGTVVKQCKLTNDNQTKALTVTIESVDNDALTYTLKIEGA
jgi:hypothetical protein